MWCGFNENCIHYFCILKKINIYKFCETYKFDIEIINKFLNNDTSLTIEELIRLAQVLETNVVNLFNEDIVPSKTIRFK